MGDDRHEGTVHAWYVAAGLPHGGAKTGIVVDPGLPFEQKVRLVRASGTR